MEFESDCALHSEPAYPAKPCDCGAILGIKTANELCNIVCREYRETHLTGKNCDGLDCEVCQITKQAEVTALVVRAETLREVGEILARKHDYTATFNEGSCMWCTVIKELLEGKMPE